MSELSMLPGAPDRGCTSEICLQGGRTHEACSASLVLFKSHTTQWPCVKAMTTHRRQMGDMASGNRHEGAHASRTGSRASAGAPAKKTWNSSFLSCRERLGSQSAAITASHTASVMCLATGPEALWLCSTDLVGCKEICLRCAVHYVTLGDT